MVKDEDRREVARRLRAIEPDDFNSYSEEREFVEKALGIWDDYDKLLWHVVADLIEPSEPEVKYVAEVKVDGWRLEKLAHDAAVELTGIDRDALLELADGLEKDADNIISAARNSRFTGSGPRMEEAKHDAHDWRQIAARIREALGVES